MLRECRVVVATALPMLAVAGFALFSSVGVPAAKAGHAAVTLRVGGTGTALGGMRLLGEAFEQDHPGIHIDVLPSLGSSGGIAALAAGKIDLALSARPLKDAERVQGLDASEYARTPIIFGTRDDNPAEDITLQQIAAAYAGKDFAWPDGTPVRLVLRPASETDTKLIRSFSPVIDRAVEIALSREELYVAINDQDNASALEKIPGSLGLTTLAQIMTEKRSIKRLALEGVVGSTNALESGQYPYAKSLFLITAEPSPSVDAFIAFVRSPKGQSILSANGSLTVGGKPAA